MKVSLTADNPEEANKIVSAVVDAYKSEVVDNEMNKRRDRVSELERLYTDKDQEVRNRRNDLKLLAEQLGAAETENLNLKQKLTLEELALYRNQSARSAISKLVACEANWPPARPNSKPCKTPMYRTPSVKCMPSPIRF